jgi:hypothetical protein
MLHFGNVWLSGFIILKRPFFRRIIIIVTMQDLLLRYTIVLLYCLLFTYFKLFLTANLYFYLFMYVNECRGKNKCL